MKRLTGVQLGRIPGEVLRQAYWDAWMDVAYVQSLGLRDTASRTWPIIPLCNQLYDALEKLAAAELMAEALGNAHRRARDWQAYAAGVFTKVKFQELRFEREQALAAWEEAQ